MDDCADLEIRLHSRDDWSYAVELRSAVPGSETVAYLGSDAGCLAEFDIAALALLDHDVLQYGRLLSDSLFADGRVRSAFAKAKAEADAAELPLRVRLVLSSDVLHGLRWEALVDPDDPNSTLATSERIRLSRYPTSADRERIRLRRRSELRALVVVANPPDLADYQLHEVDVEGEVGRVTASLGSIPADVLPDGEDRATLSTILARLRAKPYDVLYLVAHGGIYGGDAKLWLDPEPGQSDPAVPSALLADGIAQLVARPRLVVLASCESAGSAFGGAASAAGPQLVSAGIPAVLAMQGRVEMGTVARFMPTFFSELVRDGVIDRAVSVARRSIWDRPDAWRPALSMRLTTGRIWSTGFGSGPTARGSWTNLGTNIKSKECTPILGPHLLEPILGSRVAMARSLADRYRFPLAVGDRDRLHSVEQYVKTAHMPDQMLKASRAVLRDSLLERFPDDVPEELRNLPIWNSQSVSEAMNSVLDIYLRSHPESPYRRLARLKLPIYIDASVHGAMVHALRLEDTEPVVRLCPWYTTVPNSNLHLFTERPTGERPLVYHLFGRASVPESVVMGEDGFYDHLLGVSKNYQHVPNDVSAALVDTSLLILGFRLDDPEFRDVFRFIMTLEGRDLLRRRGHAAVQIEPSDDVVTDVGLAHDYFERYFTSEGLNPYWGTAEEFMDEVSETIG